MAVSDGRLQRGVCQHNRIGTFLCCPTGAVKNNLCRKMMFCRVASECYGNIHILYYIGHFRQWQRWQQPRELACNQTFMWPPLNAYSCSEYFLWKLVPSVLKLHSGQHFCSNFEVQDLNRTWDTLPQSKNIMVNVLLLQST